MGLDPFDVASSSGASLFHVSFGPSGTARVGIGGIYAPGVALDVNGVIRSDSSVSSGAGSGIQVEMTNNGSQGLIGTVSSNDLQLYTNNNPRGAITSAGLFGDGTTSPVANFQATALGANATTTVEFGKAGQTKGTCLKLYRSDGSAIYASVAAGATAFTLSTTACASVTGF
jgi:hypothetical protein